MLDNVFGIMNNVVPRFQWAEIDLAFPSYDRHFRLTSYAHMVATNEFPGLRMKIKDAFMILFSPPSIDDTNLNVLKDGNLTALDMQILIHCKSSFLCRFHAKINSKKSSLHACLDISLHQSSTSLTRDLNSSSRAPLPRRHAILAHYLGWNKILCARSRMEQTRFLPNR